MASACGHSWIAGPKEEIQPPPIAYSELRARLEDRSLMADSISALVDVEFRRADEVHSADGVLLVQAPDRLYLELDGPFGVALGALSMMEGRLLLVNWREGWKWEGTASAANLAGLGLPTPSPEWLVDLLLGRLLPPKNPDSNIPAEIEADPPRYRLEWRVEKNLRVWRIEPFGFRPAEIEEEGAEGMRVKAVMSGEGIDSESGRDFPAQIDFQTANARMRLSFSEGLRNPPLEQADFSIPGAESLPATTAFPGLPLR